MKTDSAGRGLESLPLVPLRDMVVFPHMMAPFVVGREISIRALEAALATPLKRMFLAAQKDPQLDEPKPEDIYEIGVVATVVQSLKLPNGHIKVMVEGVRRGEHHRLRAQRRVPVGRGRDLLPIRPSDVESCGTTWRKVLALFEQYAKLSHHLAFEGLAVVPEDRRSRALRRHAGRAPDGGDRREADAARAESIPTSVCRSSRTCWRSRSTRSTSTTGSTTRSRSRWRRPRRSTTSTRRSRRSTRSSAARTTAPTRSRSSRRRSRPSGMPKDVHEKADQELQRLEAMPPVSAEATVSRNYIDWLVGVPWKKASRELKDLDARRADPERGPLRPREGQGADPRVPGRPAARAEDEGLDHLFRRALRASARRRSPSRSPVRSTASSCACRSAACATRPRSGATGAPTSAPSRARSSR